jgi:hypothetical protein
MIGHATGKYEYNHKYKFTCNVGFMSKGRQYVDVTCTATGKWTEENVQCGGRLGAALYMYMMITLAGHLTRRGYPADLIHDTGKETRT